MQNINGFGIFKFKDDFTSLILCDQNELYVIHQRFLADVVLFCSQLHHQFEFHVK
jgi:hypothetical protein